MITNIASFAYDLQTASRVFEATDRSLIIIDEFGQGTYAHDGIGLFCSIIDHLSTHNKPRIIAATHYYECIKTINE